MNDKNNALARQLLLALLLALPTTAAAEVDATVSANMNTVKGAVEASFQSLDIKLVDVAVMFVHGTAVGKAAKSGSRVIVSFTQIPNEGTRIIVTTDGPEDDAMEQSVLDKIVSGSS